MDTNQHEEGKGELMDSAGAERMARQIHTMIEEAVHMKNHLRQGDLEDVISLATNIEGLAQQIQEEMERLLGKPEAPELLRNLFADL